MGEILVCINDKSVTVPAGTRYCDIISKLYPGDKSIVLVKEDNALRELRSAPPSNKNAVNVKTVSTSMAAGMETYRRSVTFLFLKAFDDVVGFSDENRVKVQFSVSKGYYCEIFNPSCKDFSLLAQKIENRMRELVDLDLMIDKFSVSTQDAISMFLQRNMPDKSRLFRFRRVSSLNAYKLGEYVDYFYGYMVPSTGYLKYFKLYPYEDGIVIQMPVKQAPDVIPEFTPQNRVAKAMISSERYAKKIGIETVADLNEKIVNGQIKDQILVEEALQEKQISEIASEIVKRGNIKFVMIAGPSSSGKTSFSHRLSVQLRARGLRPHPVAVDNYFVNRQDNPKDEFGNYNYEDLESIDTAQFDKDMNRLLLGETVEMPRYNFITGLREYKGDFLKLNEGDLLVIEGIHCLNEKLYQTLPKDNMFKVYISALTQLNIDEHNRIATTDGRLIRRIVRDAKHRGITASETLSRWESVRKGEEKNIFPFQETADVVFNSAQIYELSILKLYAEPLLFGVSKTSPEYIEANRLLKMLDYFLPLLPDYIPSNSILQEFMGHSIFDV